MSKTKIKESNFFNNLSDVHLSINSGYKYVDTNDEKLKKKFIKRVPLDPIEVKNNLYNIKPNVDPLEIKIT